MNSRTISGRFIVNENTVFHFNTGGGGSSGNKREIETETNFLLHCTEYKEIQERPLNVRNSRINILVNDKEEEKNVIHTSKGKWGG